MVPAIRIRTLVGTPSRPGISSSPSTAERIEIAGVMTPSPMISEMPM